MWHMCHNGEVSTPRTADRTAEAPTRPDDETLRCDNCHQTFPSNDGWNLPGDLCPSPHTIDPAPLCPGALRVFTQ